MMLLLLVAIEVLVNVHGPTDTTKLRMTAA
jgi:hypothetical protein